MEIRLSKAFCPEVVYTLRALASISVLFGWLLGSRANDAAKWRDAK